MAFSSFILIGTLCAAIRALKKSSLRSRRSSRQTDSCNIKDRLTDPIDPEVFFDQCVLKCSSAEWCQAKPGRHETKRLAQVTGVEKHYAIGTRVTVLPHGTREHGRH